jgi:glycosyltransferase involved in cell wall biosynthesis
MKFSVVIPTRNRLDLLSEVLDALQAQVQVGEFEVVVVDDGSSDGTWSWLQNHDFSLPFQCLNGGGRGPAAARNLGVRSANGERIAFLGDDTVPQPDWLAQHQAIASDDSVATLGQTKWHPRMPTSSFLDWLNEEGKQFGYSLISDPNKVEFPFFYSSNLTVSRHWLMEESFDEGFPNAAWEDIELGYRLLNARGLTLRYNKNALAWHDHPTSLRRFASRQRMVGRSAVYFARRHPDLAGWLGVPERPPGRLRRAVEQLFLLSFLSLLEWSGWESKAQWELCLNGYYRIGVREALVS